MTIIHQIWLVDYTLLFVYVLESVLKTDPSEKKKKNVCGLSCRTRDNGVYTSNDMAFKHYMDILVYVLHDLFGVSYFLINLCPEKPLRQFVKLHILCRIIMILKSMHSAQLKSMHSVQL